MRHIASSLRMLAAMTLLAGVLYPLITTLVAQFLFPRQSSGSMIRANGTIIGSELLGQQFQSDGYFWGRPSAVGYNPLPSGASNLGLASKALMDSVEKRKAAFIGRNSLGAGTPVPPEMLSASGSGLDPHISPEAALLQVERIARSRRLDARERDELAALVHRHIEGPQFGILGDPRVNVLLLNLALDGLK